MMILAKVEFGEGREGENGRLQDVAESYLCTMLRAGQIGGEFFTAWTKGRFNAYVRLAGPRTFDLSCHSAYGRKELRSVTKAFGRKPVWRVIDDHVEKRQSSWRGVLFLYLFTHAFDFESPVCRGDGKAPIPVCTLPIPFQQKDELYSWQCSYRDHDQIWLESGPLELPAYRQLADPNSELSQHGRSLCKAIESGTGVPTFYYLTRYWGRARKEEERLCPGCGRRWHIKRSADKPWRFWDFDFRCDRCRLVSHLGDSTDGGRRTLIGEFRGPKR